MLTLKFCVWRGGHLRGMDSVKGVRMDGPHDFPRVSRRGKGVWEERLESGKKVRSHVCIVRAFVHVYKLLPRDPVLALGVPRITTYTPSLLISSHQTKPTRGFFLFLPLVEQTVRLLRNLNLSTTAVP